MLSKKSRHLLNVILILVFSALATSAIANTVIYDFIAEIVINKEPSETFLKENFSPNPKKQNTNSFVNIKETSSMPMFTTIIQGADEQVTCADDGSTIAKFSLCGNSDNRIISLSGGTFSSVQWEQVTGGCTPDLDSPCPDNSCSYTAISSAQTLTLDASSIPAGTGAEFRVRVNGTAPWYYFEVQKSTINQNYVKTDFICGQDGRIQITGLSSAFEYSLDAGSGFGSWQGPIFENLTPGTYNVKARLKDTPGACEYPYEPIEIERKDIEIQATLVDALCFGETGSISVDVNNSVPGPYKYTLVDSSGVAQEFTTFIADDSYTFESVGFGTYTVQVETQACRGDQLNGIDPPQQDMDINGNPLVIGNGLRALDSSTEVNSSFGCSTINSVDIILNVSGGAAPYTYTVNSGPVQPSFNGSTSYSVTSAGTYDFEITDSNGCTSTASSHVEELTPPDVNATGVDGTCSNGGARINFNVVDSNGYNLSYRVNSGDAWDVNPSISVAAGTYDNIEVRYQQDDFECTITLPSVQVSTVGVISGSATKIADRTCDGSGGSIGGQIDFGATSGGSGSGYTYSLNGSNFTTTTSYTNLVAGTYTPMIQDGGGCRLELTAIVIEDIDPPTDIDFVSSDSNCSANTVDIELVATSNSPITNYSIISPVTIDNGSLATFDDLDASQSYIFQITDANNCTYTEGYSPTVVNSIRVRVRAGNDTQVCTGSSDGSGVFLIDGFENSYTYSINGQAVSGPQTNNEVSISDLAAGTYTITITDTETGCTDSVGFTVAEPATALSLTGNVTPMSCSNGNLGRVVAQPTGGWGNNRYSLTYPNGNIVGPKSGPVFGSLSAAGSYTLTVVDAEGCSDTFTFSLSKIIAPDISLDRAASDFCYSPSSGATLVVNSNAGTADIGTHNYRINGGALQSTNTFTNLSPGNYTIEVVDGNNCSDEITFRINPPLRVNISVSSEIPCGGLDGQITVNARQGYLSSATPKSYQVSSDNGANFGPVTPFTTNTFTYDTNTPGDYIFKISDNEGCVATSNVITLNPPQQIDPATVEVSAASCGRNDNGIVTIRPDATSGEPGFEINFNNLGWGTQQTFSDLVAGATYSYVVRDSRGCETAVASVTIPLDSTPSPDAQVVANMATCTTGTLEGSIDVTAVSGGSADYSYVLHNEFGVEIARVGPTSSTTTNFPNLEPGTYTVVTVDALGCRDTDTVTITQSVLDVVPQNPTSLVCSDTGFSYTVEIVGGIGPFLIRLANDPAAPVTPNSPPRQHTFSGLQFGVIYTVEVTDTATGCVYFEEIDPVSGPTTLAVTGNATPGFCDANRFGQISYEISGFAANTNLRVEVLNSDDGSRVTVESPTNVSPIHTGSYETLPGNYQVIVTDLSNDCTAATSVTIAQNLPGIDVLRTDPANCTSDGSITVQGNGGSGAPYTFAYMASGSTPVSSNFSANTTFFGPAGSYDVYVKDANGCTSFAIAEIIPVDQPLPVPTFAVDNQCAVSAQDFDIIVSVPSSVDTPRFILNGNSEFPTDNGTVWEYTFKVDTPGSYVFDVIDANGCTSQGTAEVFEFITASAEFTTMPTCNNSDGTITVMSNGGSGNFDYQLNGTDYSGSNVGPINQTDDNEFTGIAPGSYSILVTDRDVTNGASQCTFLVDNINLERAVPPVISQSILGHITCFGDDDGSIDIILQAGTNVDSPINYRLLNFSTRALIANNSSGSFTDLEPGRYEVEVVSSRNCTVLSGELVISEPPVFSISATATPFTCEPGSNRYSSSIVTVNVDDIGTPTNYRYSISGFENYQNSNTFEIIDDGTTQNITVYAIDQNGCQSTTNVTISPPSDVVATIIENDLLNCKDPERVRIQVSGTSNFTVTTTSVVPVAPVTNTPGNNYVDLFLPDVGDYLFEIQDNTPNGCAYPLPFHTVSNPTPPKVLISELKSVQCFGSANGEFSIEVTDYTGPYNYTVYSGSDTSKTTPLATGSFNTANNPENITGLAAGSYFVEVTSLDTPFCSADSNVITIRTPNGSLEVTAEPIGNVGCNDNLGMIVAEGTGGWTTAPYEYRLLYDSGSGYTEIVPFSTNNEFENLQSGDYRVEIRDERACLKDFDINLPSVPQIEAGIRESFSLQCPSSNNAVLEAFDPTTSAPGATGGYPGAGYNYRLLKLGSNNNTDIISESGLQNTPTFVGASGGYISSGWYAIRVTSNYDCEYVTDPYFVQSPPPIRPKLVMVRVPGCGGQGEMRLFVEEPDPAFTYEYRAYENGTLVGTYADMPSSASILISGNSGISYEYDIRKKNALNTCEPVRSNGIRMTDVTGIEIAANAPDDISCSADLDGRIESFVSGGVGNQMFTLYAGDPEDAFNPVSSAMVIRGPQPDGTFEGLSDRSDYYIAVTSGTTCSDIKGPFAIVRPDPIVFRITPTPVTCKGETDGAVAIEVISGGVGLIKFAMAPDFNDFSNDPDTPGRYIFDELPAGDYEFLIQDENGCGERAVASVIEPDVITASLVDVTPETCLGYADGTATISITGGTPFVDPVTFETYYKTKLIGPNSDGTEQFVRNDDLEFSNLAGGQYIVLVQDASLCQGDTVIPIELGVNLAAEIEVLYGCEGIFPYSTASVKLQETAALPELLFALDPIDPSDANTSNADIIHSWGDLPEGDHVVYIYHENGCSNAIEFTIEAFEPLTLTATKTGPNEVTAIAEGGFGNYEYFFQGESSGSNGVFVTNETTEVAIEVRDEGGCVAMITIPFEFTGTVEIPKFFTPDGDSENDVWAPKNRHFFPNIEVKIYDRYGRVVKILDQVKTWDGNYADTGNPLPTGDYWYVINANDRNKLRYVGHFTLYR